MKLQNILPMSSFGIEGQQGTTLAPAFPAGHDLMELVPVVNPHYFFRPELRMPVMNFLVSPGGDALGLVGPTGAGKTSVVAQIAARMNWPFRSIDAHSRMELPELVGQMGLECDPATGDQRTYFRYGPLALAMKEGTIFLLNEADVLDPSVMAGLNAVLEGGYLMLADNGGEIIHAHPNFRFVITGNTRGQGDETGLYSGTLSQNLASWDRIRLLEVSYLDKASEMKILQSSMPKVDPAIIETMVEIANQVRKQFVGNPDMDLSSGAQGITITFSTRTLLRWARLGMVYSSAAAKQAGTFPFPSPLAQALRESLSNRADKAMRLVLHTIAKDKFGTAWGADPVLA